MTKPRDRRGLLWSIASLTLAASASIALLFIPFLSSAFSGRGTGEQTYVVAGPRHTVLEAFGLAGVVIMLWPILITATPIVLRHRRRIRHLRGLSALLFLPLLPVGSFVIGAFYLPSGVAMLLACLFAPAGDRPPLRETHVNA